jgi:hypothetical protein
MSFKLIRGAFSSCNQRSALRKTAHRHAVWDRSEPETRHHGKANLIPHGVTMCC